MTHILSPERRKPQSPPDTAEQFRRYYMSLYNPTDILASSNTGQVDSDTYIRKSGMPCLPAGKTDVLEQNLIVEEFFHSSEFLEVG